MAVREIMLPMGGWLVPRTFYSHVMVELASLQDFKQCRNSQVGLSVATRLISIVSKPIIIVVVVIDVVFVKKSYVQNNFG